MESRPTQYSPQDIDKKWKKVWVEKSTYRFREGASREENFVIDTPPPTVSGSLHLGHMFSYTQTDIVARFQRMRGKNVFYPMGWDDNGLPTERRVQNVFGISCNLDVPYREDWKCSKKADADTQIEQVSRQNFIEACNELTLEDEAVFKETFQRLGLSVDWHQEYSTIARGPRLAAQLSFIKLLQQGDVFLQESPTMWDIDFQTAVAQAEVEDREVSGHYYDLRFDIEGGGDFVISTTRPELLPACIAIVAHPDDERYRHLFGSFALTPLFKARVPILAAEHADPEKGTGILMVCTFGDIHDVDWWKQSKLPARAILGKDGKCLNVRFGEGAFQSTNASLANEYLQQIVGFPTKGIAKKIVEWLKLDGRLIGEPRAVKRPVKFYEKGQRPLEYVTSRQWFTSILKHKKELIEQGRKISWHPEYMLSRYENWVENLSSDWCISRQRFFGVPFPVWYPLSSTGEIQYQNPILPSLDQLPVDPLKDVPPGFDESRRGKPNGFIAERDVMDTWATSSLTPQINARWGQKDQKMENLYPMDFRPQSHEIIRTWAFYTIVKSHLHERQIPWNHVAISGWILDPDRKKMSKSKGNVITPDQYIDNYGCDAFRYWAGKAKLGVDTAFDESLFKIGKKLCNKLFHASRFVLGQIETVKKGTEIDANKITVPVDIFWIYEMQKMLAKATIAFESFDYAEALQLIEESFWKFCDDYIEIVKVRSYQAEDLVAKESALETLDWSLQVYLRAFAPFIPFLSEEIWSWRSFESVHWQKWPSKNELKIETTSFVEDEISPWTQMTSIVAEVRAQKTREQKNLRWPVESLTLSGPARLKELVNQIKMDLQLCSNFVPNAKINYVDNEEAKKITCEVVLAKTDQ